MINFLKKHYSRIVLLAFSVDFLILLLTGYIAFIALNKISSFDILNARYLHVIPAYLVAFIIISQMTLFISELYIIEKKYQKKILISKCIISFIIVSIICYALSQKMLPYLNYLVLSMAACLLIVCWRFIFYWIVQKLNIQHKVLFIGTDDLAKMVVREILSEDHLRYKVVGFVGTDPAMVGKHIINPMVLGVLDDLAPLVEKEKVDKIIISFPEGRGAFPTQDLLKCKFKGVQVLELHSFYEHLKGKILLNGLRPSWLIFNEGFNKAKITLFGKRIVDLIISSLGLMLTMPVSLITALLIKLDSKGPVIYQQERVGVNGQVFKLYKFRSMKADAEKYSGPVWAQEDDPRITRVGKFIRKVRIDEIPQMINVLKGDMSFVGPRPERPVFVNQLRETIPYYDQRHTIKPGITGWAAVKFHYGASLEDVVEKMQYDLYYIKNLSLFLDMLIILKTIPIILGRRGAR